MTGPFLRRALHRTERIWDKTRFAVKRRTGLLGTPVVVPYRGFAGPEGVWLRGRVLEDQGVASAPHSASTLRNLWLTLKRYETDEVGGATIGWRRGEERGTLLTDEEGYFGAVLPLEPGVGEAPWLGLDLDLQDVPHHEFEPVEARAAIRVASPSARLGIISDIDDTIIETGATNFLKHWRTVVANSAHSRTAFPGVGAFYRALAEGDGGPETHPVFYVSSSPWNLYDLFERFMVLHDIPLGPILLKDFGLDAGKWLTGGHDDHKLERIGWIMAAFPALTFILIGDSGQRDAVIYEEAARRHPGRVAAVHIRDVTGGRLAAEAETALSALRETGIAVTLADTLRPAARQALEAGLIDHRQMANVEAAIAGA
ncbi:App1 family protein [Aurantimonas sp. VKM B-3413]|uniref:App1 family protein n=1 Tax=Aurantimonas sp. VKM B-3413 TaxID=2779401 RepID=UPI001E591E28|nr:App1 family protein [Aurantimonas sp. VKM B-3413]MCB8837450.1 App1 family protein [Aurantimonas sp. VKM B-3413]